MIILSLDLGTKTGYALGISKDLSVSDKTIAGTKVLATDSELRADKKIRGDRRFDCRVTNLFDWLREMLHAWNPDVVVFEDVRFAISQAQAHLWGSLRGAVWSACVGKTRNIRVDCLETGKLKIEATGHGHADKNAMARALVRKEPGEFILYANGLMQVSSAKILDDNAVDAIHLLRWAQKIYEKP